MDRAGIQAYDRKRGEGHEEYVLFEQLKVLEHFDENDVLCQKDVVERLDIFVAVLDGDAVTKSYCLDLVVTEPLSGLSIDKESLVNFCIGSLGEGLKLISGIDDDDIAFFNFVSHSVKVCFRNVCVGSYGVLEIYIDAASYECRQRKCCNIRPIVIMMIRALRMSSQMAHDIEIGVEIRNRTAGVEAVQFASSGLGCRINELGKIDHSHAIS